jgi:hypothetical protein
VSGRRGSGSFGSGRTAGYAIGEDRTSPWLEAIAGIRSDHVPGWAPSPCRLPGPVTRYGAVVTATQARPFRAPVSVLCGAGCAGRSRGGVRAGQSESGRLGVNTLGLWGSRGGRNYSATRAQLRAVGCFLFVQRTRRGLPLYPSTRSGSRSSLSARRTRGLLGGARRCRSSCAPIPPYSVRYT